MITFLQDELKLVVNLEKSGIAHSSDKSIIFLGCYIRYHPNKIVADIAKSIEDGAHTTKKSGHQ